MFLFSREKKVAALILEHLHKVRECLQQTRDTVNQYFQGDLETAKSTARLVDQTETEADSIRRLVIDQLYQGAFLPNLRQDVHKLVSELDDVGNAAESNCDFLLGERPLIPEELKPEIQKIYEITLKQFSLLETAIKEYIEGSDSDVTRIRDQLKKVGILESEIDEVEWHLTRAIFLSDLELSRKLHLRTWVRLSSQLSDQIENLSDSLHLLVLKSTV